MLRASQLDRPRSTSLRYGTPANVRDSFPGPSPVKCVLEQKRFPSEVSNSC